MNDQTQTGSGSTRPARRHRGPRFAAWWCLALVLVLVAVACGDDDDDDATSDTGTADTGTADTGTADTGATEETTGGEAAAGGVYDVDLTGICPDPLVIQTDWFPEADHGGTYQMIGPGGTVDATAGTYSGPLANTGITLEIRAGGPYINFAAPVQQIYADPEIFAGYADTGDVIRNSGGDQPVVSVFAFYDKGPQMLMWDPEVYDFTSFEEIRDSGATVLYFEGGAYMDYLLAEGLLNADQVDASYDGSTSRFAAEGDLVQQGFATAEPYTYENDVPEWAKPVEYLLTSEAGYDIYQSAVSVRPDTITEYGDCLAALVPIMQQSAIDYLADPGPVNTALVDIVTQLDSFWTLSEGLNAYGVETMTELSLVSDAGDGIFGNFDCDRVDGLIETVTPIYEEQGTDIPDDLACADVVSNDFIDTSISLGD